MNLRGLESLVAIGETQSFVEAARQVGFSQSTISTQIKALEQELGVELFDRSVRPPIMTPAGIAITQSAREIRGGRQPPARAARRLSYRPGQVQLPMKSGSAPCSRV